MADMEELILKPPPGFDQHGEKRDDIFGNFHNVFLILSSSFPHTFIKFSPYFHQVFLVLSSSFPYTSTMLYLLDRFNVLLNELETGTPLKWLLSNCIWFINIMHVLVTLQLYNILQIVHDQKHSMWCSSNYVFFRNGSWLA